MEIAYECFLFTRFLYIAALRDADWLSAAGGAWTGAGSGWVWPRPGRKNEAGEMLWEALIPPQPVKSAAARQERASPKIFRSNLTGVEYRYKGMRLATTNW